MCHIERFGNLVSRLCEVNRNLFQVDQIHEINLDNLTGRAAPWGTIRRGIYMFLTQNTNTDQPIHSQIVRVGTHGNQRGGGNTTLWDRLRGHKGNVNNGGGNHRGSIFRLLVGDAIIRRDGLNDIYPDWGNGLNAPNQIREQERPMEQCVSKYIRQLPFLVIRVDPADNGPEHRGYLEKNLIAMLSQIERIYIQPWLGEHSSRAAVRDSKLWNIRHTNEEYNPEFLDLLEEYINEMENPNV